MVPVEKTQGRRLERPSVHSIGAVWGLLAILAIVNHEWQVAFVWMAMSIFVDGFDGFLARRARVKEVLPGFDGALLDNMIDYLNYVMVPALFVYVADFLPTNFALVGAVFIMFSSAYQFCQGDAKTDDHYFKGFPSYWNIMVFYLFVLNLGHWTNLAIIIVLSILVFVPIHYIYPSRTERAQTLTMGLGIIWGVVNVIILALHPDHAPWLVWASLLYVVYYSVASIYFMLKD